MTELHPVGSTVPIQPWLIDDIQRRAQGNRKASRARAARDRYLVERFQAWRIYPVRVGRWQRVPVIEDPLGDGLAAVMFLFVGPFRSANWQQARNLMQVLDPATGQPVSEIAVGGSRDGWTGLTDVTAIAFLGDPRVAGLVAPVGAEQLDQVPFAINRRGPQTEWSPQTFEQEGPRLASQPYRDFADRDDGPWLADQPEKPTSGSNRWKPSPWYRPQS
ncbi:hypothetical protein KDK95_24325 [Actinospica sp. MGRD01-02]|uniref:Uncharacterized protein n=1 Tax=Actinospica acidithermotolerans TaxID=2828514 RepID=A0A941IIB2_9ACTN|nr:hypothetical protein [Actinospica acidithermotolerans]MBR7829455.1 hypothetical protein [Actinospica acidithermotolerans]